MTISKKLFGALCIMFALTTTAFGQAPTPGFSKSFLPATIGVGANSTLTFIIDNSDFPTPVSDLAFSDTLPAGMTLSAAPNGTSTCTGGTLSAPAGGSTISYSGGGVGAYQSCTISVNVTATVSGDNISGSLTSSAGNSGSASATLTVDVDLPSFSKAFAPSTVPLNATPTLTFTIDNSGYDGDIQSLAFSDVLPAGLTIASTPNASTDCGSGAPFTTLTAAPGSSTIAFSDFGFGGPALAAGATCTVQVDVLAGAVGVFGNTSSDLAVSYGAATSSAGTASATLTVDPLSTTAPTLTKTFTNDPVGPGQTATLNFAIYNPNPSFAASAIAFSDVLDTNLTGATLASVNSNSCGGSLTGTGTNTLNLAGVTLAPRANCAISVEVQVPVSATAGGYANTTSPITANVNGSPEENTPATDTLQVLANAPLTISKSFTSVAAGNPTTLTFTLTNPNPGAAASNAAFQNLLTDILPEPLSATLPPATDTCGGTMSFYSPGIGQGVDYSGGSVAAGGSCTIAVLVDVPSGVSPGIYPNTSGPVSATIGGATLVGGTATASLTVTGGLNLSLAKSFQSTHGIPGGTVDVSFTISNSGEGVNATQVAFTDDIETFDSGTTLASVGANSCGGSLVESPAGTLSFTGGSVNALSDCTITATLTLGTEIGTLINNTSDVSASPNGGPVESDSGSAGSDSIIVGANLPVLLSKAFLDDPVIAGGTTTLRFTLTNPNTGEAASAIAFTDNYGAVLPGLDETTALPMSACGGTVDSVTGFLFFTGGSLAVSETCSFDIELLVPPATASGSYNNITSAVSATIGGVSYVGAPATDQLIVENDILAVVKQFTSGPILPGENATMRLTLSNLSAAHAITALAISDDLNAMLAGTTGTEAANTCGGTVTPGATIALSGGGLGTGASCYVDIDVTVPAAAGEGVYPNTTTDVSGLASGLAVTGPAASDSLIISSAAGALAVSKAFTDDPVLPGAVALMQLTIQNLSASSGVSNLALTDDLNAMLAGTTGAVTANTCGGTASVSAGGLVSLTGGLVENSSSCTVEIAVTVPAGAAAGLHLNTTGIASGEAAGLAVYGPAASDSLEVISVLPPVLTKEFLPDIVGPGFQTVLRFTITNPGTGAPQSDLSFTDDLSGLGGLSVASLPAGPVCGTGAITGTTLINVSGASVAVGSSCSFDVTLNVSPTATPGEYLNTTSDLFAGGVAVSGPASAGIGIVDLPIFSKAFAPASIEQGETSTLSFTVDNSGSLAGASALTFTDAFPAGMEVAALPNAADSCGGSLTAAAGATSISYSGGAVAAASSCTISVDVRATGSGPMANTSGDLTSSLGNSGPASATLNVGAAPLPVFAKAFTPSTILQVQTSTLSFTIDNSTAAVAATALAFTDSLPAAVTVAATPNSQNTCGGTLTAAAGGSAISLSGGSVLAGGSCALSVDVTSSTTGAHVNTTGDLTSSLGNSGTAIATLTVDANPFGSVTIVQNTDADGTFGFSSSEALLTFDIVTAGGTGQHGPVSLTSGTYIVTQSRPAGLGNTDIVCSDANSSGDPATGILTLNIEGLEAVVCTITSIASGQKTLDTINSFLTKRTDLILANRPDPNRRIDRLNRGTGAERLAYTPGNLSAMIPFTFNPRSLGTGNYRFSTSMAQVTRAAAAMSLADGAEGDFTTYQNRAWDVWFEAAYSTFDGLGGSGGYFGIAYLGADVLVTPDLLVGALVQYDVMRDSSTTLAYTTQGEGWMAGPYLTARLSQNLFLDARIAWGNSSNQISPFNTYTDSFSTSRWLASASLIGDYTQGNWTFRPNASLSFMEETQAAYVDSLSVLIPSQTVTRGQVRIGPNISTRLQGANGTVYEPHFTLDAIYNLESTSGAPISSPAGPPDGWRGRLEGGVRVFTQGGARLSFTGHYDGLGQPGYASWGAGLELEFSF